MKTHSPKDIYTEEDRHMHVPYEVEESENHSQSYETEKKRCSPKKKRKN